MTAPDATHQPRNQTRQHQSCVAEVVRSGFVEGHHYGSVVVLEADGTPGWSVGDVTSAIFPRSCNKPFQAVGMLRCGLDLPPDLLALAAASHSGEDFHLEGVRRILAGAGLEESALQTPADYPVEDWIREETVRSGAARSSIFMNCSGKHAAMLATCVHNGWDVATYRAPEHPLQVAIRAAMEELTGERAEAVGIDGCGAPLLSASLTGLARGFQRIGTAAEGTVEHRLAMAYRRFPEYASGTYRDEAKLLRAVPGTIGKAGAEACYAVALPDGRAIALKIDDGGTRARAVVMTAVLRRLGVEHPVLDEIGTVTLLGGGEPVGLIRATL
ncbi:MAG TPA: asparaginase [Nocardioidaceae bacterium]|nr:asparaginase [Nocardioidaceae bacterium]